MDKLSQERFVIYPVRAACRMLMLVAFAVCSMGLGGVIYLFVISEMTLRDQFFCLIPFILTFLFPIWGSANFISGAHLAFTREKLVYSYLGMVGSTPWENVIELRYESINRRWTLVLEKALVWDGEKSRMIAILNQERFKRSIPLTNFVGLPANYKDLEKTQFGRDLLDYAPHLFAYGKEKPKNG